MSYTSLTLLLFLIRLQPVSPLFPYTTLFRSGQGGDQEQDCIDRQYLGNTSKFSDLTGMAPVIDHANQKEQGSCGETVVDHLDDGPLHRHCIECKDTEHNKTEVTDRRVGNQLLYIFLNHGHQCIKDNSDHSENRKQW